MAQIYDFANDYLCTAMSQKDEYIELCTKGEARVPIYMQPWWLDAVCTAEGKTWDAILAHDGDGRCVAALPFHVMRKYGLRLILNAQLTPHFGLWFADNLTDDERSRYARQLFGLLARQRFDALTINAEKNFPFAQEAQSQGFRMHEHYTYVISDIHDPESLIPTYHPMKRRQVLKARKTLHTEVNAVTPQAFYDFYTACLAQRKRTINYSRSFFLAMSEAALRHEQGAFFSVVDAKGTLHAILFCAWDEQCAYALTYAIDHQLRNSGASALMMHDAIAYLATRTQAFDFEGGNDPAIGASYSKFGSRRTPSPTVAMAKTIKGKILGKLVLGI